jgi:hypothetical protein
MFLFNKFLKSYHEPLIEQRKHKKLPFFLLIFNVYELLLSSLCGFGQKGHHSSLKCSPVLDSLKVRLFFWSTLYISSSFN